MDLRNLRKLSKFYALFRHIRTIGKIAKKKAIDRFERNYRRIRNLIDFIYISIYKQRVLEKLVKIMRRENGIIIYDINFEKNIPDTHNWKKIKENKKLLKRKHEYSFLTAVNLLDNALRWFHAKILSKGRKEIRM